MVDFKYIIYMELDVIITGAIGLATSVITGIASYFFTRRKYNAEVDNNIIENMKQTLDFYMKLSDDNSKRLENILKINEDLEREVAELKKQVEKLTEQLRKYREEK